MVLGWMYIHGYHSTFLVRQVLPTAPIVAKTRSQLGGATANVGDPTDRLKSRDHVPSGTRKANMAAMHVQLKALGALIESYADRRGFSREWA
jgi:tyrosyl-tRNA synthetase